jgi:hypothetical protein
MEGNESFHDLKQDYDFITYAVKTLSNRRMSRLAR